MPVWLPGAYHTGTIGTVWLPGAYHTGTMGTVWLPGAYHTGTIGTIEGPLRYCDGDAQFYALQHVRIFNSGWVVVKHVLMYSVLAFLNFMFVRRVMVVFSNKNSER